MHSNRTVILGEASEESDCEEISLDEEIEIRDSSNNELHNNSQPIPKINPVPKQSTSRFFNSGSSLLASIGSATSLAYNLIAPNTSQQASDKPNPSMKLSTQPTSQMPLLHSILYAKNQQFYIRMAHLHRHPYQKATKDFNSISQRLVYLQKNLQDIDLEMTKLKRERKNLDIDINMIAQST